MDTFFYFFLTTIWKSNLKACNIKLNHLDISVLDVYLILDCNIFVQDINYQAISGFLFLRFLAPAILGPKLFSLRDHHADKIISRTLTLLAKVRKFVYMKVSVCGRDCVCRKI